MEVDHEFMKDRAAAGSVDHVVNLQFGKRAIAPSLPNNGLVIRSRSVSSLRGGTLGMSRFIFVIFSHAFCWEAVMIGTSSSGESTRSVRKRRIWMDRSLVCSAA